MIVAIKRQVQLMRQGPAQARAFWQFRKKFRGIKPSALDYTHHHNRDESSAKITRRSLTAQQSGTTASSVRGQGTNKNEWANQTLPVKSYPADHKNHASRDALWRHAASVNKIKATTRIVTGKPELTEYAGTKRSRS